MGLTTKTINSSLLGKKMNIAVCVPDAYENIPLPVLYFLHGRTGNETLLQWFEMDKRASSLIESGIIKPLIIVCPIAEGSIPRSIIKRLLANMVSFTKAGMKITFLRK